jgi:hypothetical protein
MRSRTAFGIGLTIAAVAVGGWKNAIPGLDLAQAAHEGASPLEATVALTQASGALAGYYRSAGTYAGAQIGPTAGVRLAWASDVGYCLVDGSLHLLGPSGVPQSGPCPPG